MASLGTKLAIVVWIEPRLSEHGLDPHGLGPKGIGPLMFRRPFM